MLKPLFHNKKTIISIIFAFISLSVLGFSVIVWADNEGDPCWWRSIWESYNYPTCSEAGCPGCDFGSSTCTGTFYDPDNPDVTFDGTNFDEFNFDTVGAPFGFTYQTFCGQNCEDNARPRLFKYTRFHWHGAEHESSQIYFEEGCCETPNSSYTIEYIKENGSCVKHIESITTPEQHHVIKTEFYRCAECYDADGTAYDEFDESCIKQGRTSCYYGKCYDPTKEKYCGWDENCEPLICPKDAFCVDSDGNGFYEKCIQCNPGEELCGETCYNPETQKCCEDNKTVCGINEECEDCDGDGKIDGCCDRSLAQQQGQDDCCCGDKFFDPSKEKCCGEDLANPNPNVCSLCAECLTEDKTLTILDCDENGWQCIGTKTWKAGECFPTKDGCYGCDVCRDNEDEDTLWNNCVPQGEVLTEEYIAEHNPLHPECPIRCGFAMCPIEEFGEKKDCPASAMLNPIKAVSVDIVGHYGKNTPGCPEELDEAVVYGHCCCFSPTNCPNDEFHTCGLKDEHGKPYCPEGYKVSYWSGCDFTCGPDSFCCLKWGQATHKECGPPIFPYFCLDVPGEGENECSTIWDCWGAWPQGGHNRCFQETCILVPGPGVNECENDEDCQNDNRHNECVFDREEGVWRCETVEGEGGDECFSDEQCDGVHNECVFDEENGWRCVQKEGEMPDVCEDDADCFPNVPPTAENLRARPIRKCFSDLYGVILEWDFSDEDGDEMQAYRISIKDSGGNCALKNVESDDECVLEVKDKHSTHSFDSTSAELHYDENYTWTLQVQDSAGNWSEVIQAPDDFSAPKPPETNFSWETIPPGEEGAGKVLFTDKTICHSPPCIYSWEFREVAEGEPEKSSEQDPEPILFFPDFSPPEGSEAIQGNDKGRTVLKVTDSYGDGLKCVASAGNRFIRVSPHWREISPFEVNP